MELARRCVAEPTPSTVLQDVAWYIGSEPVLRPQETFVVIMLSAKNAPIAHKVVSVGTLNATLVHPREVFRPAIRFGAATMIACHNHSSGDPTPSAKDIALTRRLKEASQIVSIELLDHVIIGQGISL